MGAIDSEYTLQNGETGVLGTPRAPKQAARDGRAMVRFYRNGAIYWTPENAAAAIYGPIFQAWMQAGGENSALGYPVSDEVDENSAYYRTQSFEHGTISWNQQHGATIQMYTSNELR